MPTLNSLHLNGLRAVETVARTGSLILAAKELGVSPSAVSQQINRTEKQLGCAVFSRTGSGLVLTAFGAVFAARLTLGFRELAQAAELADDDFAGPLVVSVAPAFAGRWLVPRLSRFFALHPELRLRIDASKRIADLDHSDIDIAIRLGDGNWPDVRAELLLAQEIFPVCAPALAARLHSIADLASVCVLSDENTMITWDRWFDSAGVAPVASIQGASFTDPTLCIEAAIAGHGVMLAWHLLAADALADKRLVAPFGVTATSGLGYYLVTSRTKRQTAKVTDFKRWVIAEVEATMARFASATAS